MNVFREPRSRIEVSKEQYEIATEQAAKYAREHDLVGAVGEKILNDIELERLLHQETSKNRLEVLRKEISSW